MEEQLGWQHGIHFVYMAPMNTMAALIDGGTIHSLGGVRTYEAAGGTASILRKKQEADLLQANPFAVQYAQCRLVVIDEFENVRMEDFSDLEYNFRKDVPTIGDTYAMRASDGH